MKMNQKGFIMVLSMVVMVVLTVMGVGGLMISGFQQDIAGRLRCRTKSLQCTEIGRSMILSRFNPNIDISSFPFPVTIDTSTPGVCSAIFVGHLPDSRSNTGVESVPGMSAVFCTNNVGCSDIPGSGNNYRTTIVGQAENCEPVEVEMIIYTAS